MDDLKYIKKHYGENFMHLCRELFPSLLEQEGLLSGIISKRFPPSRNLYNDVLKVQDEFKSYIFSHVDVEQEAPKPIVTKSPEELMDEAGYILYPECKTEEDVQSFKKYYAKGEELCTFWSGRLERCRVWFAVKKNVDEIKREDFKNPTRQDEYGTSVISIQFSHGKNSTLSIKNRYNHNVNNPDCTFGNHLDNIIEGLEDSFVEKYKINLISKGAPKFEIPGYRQGDDGKFYKVNFERYNVCYCGNNVIINNGAVNNFDRDRYIIADNFIFDMVEHRVRPFVGEHEDSFKETIGEGGEFEKMTTAKDDNGNQVIVITPHEGDKIEITLNENNAIIGYSNPNVTEIGDKFMAFNEALCNFYAPNLKKVGSHFLYENKALETLTLPSLEHAGGCFLYKNFILKCFDAKNLTMVGAYFLTDNRELTSLYLPKLRKASDYFLSSNEKLVSLDFPVLQSVGNDFLSHNGCLTNLNAPNLQEVGDDFLLCNNKLTNLDLPNLKKVGEWPLRYNRVLTSFNAPRLKNIEELSTITQSVLNKQNEIEQD